MTEPVTLAGVRPYDGGEPVDLVLRDGLIASITPAGAAPHEGEVVDAGGRWVGPGLWDAHVHFTQHVNRRRRLDLTETRSADDVLDIVRRARAADAPLTNGMLMGYGFRDGLWPVPATLDALDAAVSDMPVVLVSGDLHCGWMNRAAARRFGLALDETGLLREGPWIELLHSFDEASSLPLDAYREAADAASARGVVGIVEYEKTDNVTEWSERTASGLTNLRADIAVWPDLLEAVIADGRRTGDVVDEHGLITFGRLKVVVDGSLNTRAPRGAGIRIRAWTPVTRTRAGWRACRSPNCGDCWSAPGAPGSRPPCTRSATARTPRCSTRSRRST
ncbi:putative amidohydrolase YtcJ [Microbacterium sp. W4I20]|nr:putative amidohydrolase YtcJ [Microbacterium sp. W4I20]